MRRGATDLGDIEVFSTCPQSKDIEQAEYLERVGEIARWSEKAGYRGILVYTDNSIADPWLVSQVILEQTETLSPLVAIQPIYMHPYSVAKMITTLGFLHGRRLYLNMLAGGFKNDLLALGDDTPHDERYDRTVEYTRIVLGLLEGKEPVSIEGKYYRAHAGIATGIVSWFVDLRIVRCRARGCPNDLCDSGQVPQAARRRGGPAIGHRRLRRSRGNRRPRDG